jgi:hypothetical protein
MMLVYMTQNLDKGALGTASIMGMQKDTVSWSLCTRFVCISLQLSLGRAWLDKITPSPQPLSG